MKQVLRIMLRAVIIVVFFGSIGLSVNWFSPKGIPWIYLPPTELVIDDVKVPLVEEKEAFRYLGESSTAFLDTRREEDYREGHIQGALFLPPDDVEERFVAIQQLLPEESRLILYCYGPECEMAERVAQFLAQMGYKNMMIMTAGFRVWEQAGYPVEGAGKRN